jgi:hypothetical protein
VTVRHMYAATAVSDKGQLQGAAPKGSAQGRQTACVYRELVTARTKCYSIDEGSSVDCTIEDTKLQKEEGEGRSWP